MKAIKMYKFGRSLAILGFWLGLLGLGTMQAQNVEKDSTHWVGEWRDDGNLQYGFNLYLKPLGGGNMGGYFEWKLLWTWLPDHVSKVGSVAKEYLVGKYDPTTRTLKLQGVRQNDPADIISMDTYIIDVSADQKRIEGINVKPENYHGSMFGVYIPPKKPVVVANAGKSNVAPAVGEVTKSKEAVKPDPGPAKGTSVPEPAKPVSPAAGADSPGLGKDDKELLSREIVTKRELTSQAAQVRIKIYDESMIDGDVVSLNWNGTWVLRYYRVAKLPKEILLDLSPGENTLVMHAENLGKYPPNTASIAVQRGSKTEVFVLNSDMGKSEAIKFVKE